MSQHRSDLHILLINRKCQKRLLFLQGVQRRLRENNINSTTLIIVTGWELLQVSPWRRGGYRCQVSSSPSDKEVREPVTG